MVTFSVLPALTLLWAKLLLSAGTSNAVRILVGDCSGGLDQRRLDDQRLSVFPVFNHPHGAKLDLFMKKVCSTRNVLICDDDILWLQANPLHWALNELNCRPRLAAVSLYPRESPKPVMKGKVEQPMGSFCLVINRDIWIEESLSFQPYDTTGQGEYDWTYDTADHAHVELLSRGYEVAIAPPEIRADLSPMEGVSTWALKLQKYDGDVSHLLQTDIRQRKAYRVFRFLTEIQTDLEVLCPECGDVGLVHPEILNRGLDSCKSLMDKGDVVDIDQEVFALVDRIRIASASHPTKLDKPTQEDMGANSLPT